jgi:class 3 adenylate cyclase
VSVGLGYVLTVAARRRRDARLFLVSLGFLSSAGFLGLHALATPGVLVGPNAGFELATPVGLLLGAVLVSASAIEFSGVASGRLLARANVLLAGLVALVVVWGVLSLAEVPPLDAPLQKEELDSWQTVLASAGAILYGLGAAGYLRLYRRRGDRLVFAVTIAFALLAEAMIVIALAQNWQISWWEWHGLMFCAFVLVALAARREWHEERFSPLYLDETLAGVREASILFADLAGYTRYSEQKAPEAVAEMLNDYFGRLVPLMRKLGGEVHQLMGDAIMVVFNKQGDQPDHALLAARAALALQCEADLVARGHPEWPRFRVGVNSGTVLAGVIGERGHRKHDLVGDTVNLAARLEGQAPVGEVVVGAGTFDNLPAGAQVERLPALQVKGKAQPIVAYLLTSLPDPGP